MVPGFSKQHLCNRDLTKVRIPRILAHDPHDSRLPNPYLAEVRGKQRVSQPLHNTRKTAPPRGAGHAIVPERTPGAASRCAQWRCRAPSGSAMRSAFPAQRQAAGARSVRSQPFRRPSRDRADRATLGRQRRPRRPVPIEPRGPAAGNPTKPDRPALSRIRPTVFNVSDGQAGSPPPQCPPNLVWTRNRGRPGHAKNPAPSGCRARYCAGTNPRRRVTLRTMALPGSPGERDAVCFPGYEAGRRRSISAVAALPATFS